MGRRIDYYSTAYLKKLSKEFYEKFLAGRRGTSAQFHYWDSLEQEIAERERMAKAREAKAKMKLITAALIGVMMSGCATAYKTNRLSVGMTKPEVIAALGQPARTSADSGKEYLIFNLYERGGDAALGLVTPYFVRIVDGVVDGFGRLGDMGSTAMPAERATIDLNITEK